MTNLNTTMTTEPKKIVSIFYEGMKETHDEKYIGAFDNLRNNDWITGYGCPFSNKQLKEVEKKVKKSGAFMSHGTFGTKSIFYFDKKTSKFVVSLIVQRCWLRRQHNPRFLCETLIIN